MNSPVSRVINRIRFRWLLVFPAESNSSVLKCDQTMVGDSHSMGIAAEVIEHLGGAAEGRLGVDDPVCFAGTLKVISEGPGILQAGQFSAELEFPMFEGFFEVGKELAAKHARQHAHGQEESSTARHPAAAVG
jgi:hypothetical protein